MAKYTDLYNTAKKYIGQPFEYKNRCIIIKSDNGCGGYVHQLGTEGCPLCIEYRNGMGNCNNCPIKNDGHNGCANTPYENLINCIIPFNIVSVELLDAIDKELSYLKELLYKIITEIQTIKDGEVKKSKTEVDIELLDKSIDKYEKIYDHLQFYNGYNFNYDDNGNIDIPAPNIGMYPYKTNIGSSNCPLCSVYHDKHCIGCPVNMDGNHDHCDGTAWHQLHKLLKYNLILNAEIINAVKDELQFLKDLKSGLIKKIEPEKVYRDGDRFKAQIDGTDLVHQYYICMGFMNNSDNYTIIDTITHHIRGYAPCSIPLTKYYFKEFFHITVLEDVKDDKK